jgi:hypothetical protein
MTKTLMTLAAVSTLALAAPAVSQTSNTNMDARITVLQNDIQAGVRNRTITRAEAQMLRGQLRALRDIERQYQIAGYTRAERQDLNLRIRNLRGQVRFAARNDLTVHAWVDVNGDGWHDHDRNRDGLVDGARGLGGPYVPVATACAQPSGLFGVINSIFGNESCDLRPGMRVPGNLYPVPQAYANAYRDGNGVYYRSDGDTIYQIDARTHTVIRLFDLD